MVWCGIVLVAGLALLREIDIPVTDSLWAEDGSIFLGGAIRSDSTLEPLLDPYRGYIHLVPRTLAAIIVLFPLHLWPWIVSALSAAVAVSVAVFVFYASENIIASPLLRGIMAAWLVINPVTPEVSANLANLHWFLLIGTFWAYFAPNRRNMNAVGRVVVAASALSNPVTGAVSLVGVFRTVKERSRRLLLLSGVGIVGASIHLFVENFHEPPTVSVLPLISGLDLWTSSIAGVFGGADLVAYVRTLPWTLVTVSAVTIIAIAAGPLLVLANKATFVVSAVLISIIFTFGLALLRQIESTSITGRFLLVPSALILGVIFAAVAEGNRAWIICTALIVVAAMTFNLLVGTRHSQPRWSEAIANALSHCDRSDMVTLPIHPSGWMLPVPCDLVMNK